MKSKKAEIIGCKSELTKLATGAGIAGTGDVAGNAIHYLSSIVITRTIGAELYGLYFLGNVIVNIGGLISRLGLNYGMLRFVALFRGKSDAARIKGTIISGSKLSFGASMLVSLLLFFLSDFLANAIFKKPGLVPAIKILALAVPFTNMMILWLNTLLGFQKITYKICVEKIFQPLVKLTLLIVLFLFGLRFLGVLLATVLSFLLACGMAWYYMRKRLPHSVWANKPVFENKKLIQFSLPVFLDNILNYVIQWLDILMLGFLSTSFEVGVFGAVVRLTLFVTFALSAFNAIFAPMISELYGKSEIRRDGKELARLEQLYKMETKWILTLTLPVFLGLIFFPKPILGIWGASFKVGATALIVMSIARFVDAAVGSAGFMIMMIGKPKINLMNSVVLGAMKVIFNVILIPRYGLLGAAITSGVSIATINLARLAEVYYFLKIHPYKLNFLKPLVAGITGIGALVIFKNIIGTMPHGYFPVATGIAFLVVYISLLWLLKLDEEDRLVLKYMGHRIRLYRS